MAKKMNRYEMLYPLGVTLTEDGAEILVQAEAETMTLVLYRTGESEEPERIHFKPEERIGNVWTMSLSGYDFANLEYGFEADGKWMVDPCAKAVTGREVWGDTGRAETAVKARMASGGFAWDDDKNPVIPYSETIIYRLHVRGFTKHEASYIRNKGTFAGIVEMIPYLKELGITTVELMPVTEFDEVIKEEIPSEIPGGKSQMKPNGKLNYWGYGPSFLYAPKASYGTGFMPVETEFKIMVKELHGAGMECVLEMFFTGEETVGQVLDVLRYWVQEYHVDGFKLSGAVPTDVIAEDPFLANTKLFAEDWQSVLSKQKNTGGNGAKEQKTGSISVREKNLAEYNDKFQTDMRRILRGDQGMVESLMKWTMKNPGDHAVINYMANTNGFTMMDMVSYDEKHNEANGEENQDGSDCNFSWNCGVEGRTDAEKVLKLRKQQLYNAFMLLLFSQGTPLIMAGDEFGNSQNGNNNAYCQDNETGWLDWKLLEENADLFLVVKEMIAFRKAHKAFHMDHAAKNTDYKSLGCPDVSFHGQSAWKTDTDYFRKQLGVMYWGPYSKTEEGTPDYTFYVAYNMHWGTHKLGLPRLPKGQVWKVLYDTSGGAAIVKDRIHAQVSPYSIVVFVAVEETGYYTYELPIGEVTLVCEKGAMTELRFGRVTPEHAEERGIQEERLELLDKAYSQLAEYFAGERRGFDLPFATEGTEFQEKVWAALQTIPYGETRSYKEIAVQIGNENASRAVGMANNRNPLAIFVPCHRVVGADGGIVGYAGGTDIKMQLLELEKKYRDKLTVKER